MHCCIGLMVFRGVLSKLSWTSPVDRGSVGRVATWYNLGRVAFTRSVLKFGFMVKLREIPLVQFLKKNCHMLKNDWWLSRDKIKHEFDLLDQFHTTRNNKGAADCVCPRNAGKCPQNVTSQIRMRYEVTFDEKNNKLSNRVVLDLSKIYKCGYDILNTDV